MPASLFPPPLARLFKESQLKILSAPTAWVWRAGEHNGSFTSLSFSLLSLSSLSLASSLLYPRVWVGPCFSLRRLLVCAFIRRVSWFALSLGVACVAFIHWCAFLCFIPWFALLAVLSVTVTSALLYSSVRFIPLSHSVVCVCFIPGCGFFSFFILVASTCFSFMFFSLCFLLFIPSCPCPFVFVRWLVMLFHFFHDLAFLPFYSSLSYSMVFSPSSFITWCDLFLTSFLNVSCFLSYFLLPSPLFLYDPFLIFICRCSSLLSFLLGVPCALLFSFVRLGYHLE